MKIIYFYQYFGTPKGSWSTRVYELTRRWVQEGHEVTVVTSPYDKSDIKGEGFISKQTIEGINLIVINSGDSNRYSKLKRVFRAMVFTLTGISYALFQKYDVLIASSGPITIGLPLIMAKLLRGKKTTFEVRDLWPAGGIELGLIKDGWQKKLMLWFEKVCYRSADQIVTASIGQKDHIAKRFPDKQIEVIPNASDNDLFGHIDASETLPEWTKNKKLLTHIGSLGLIHNVNYWIDVAFELSKLDTKDEFVLVFIGDGADRDSLESRVQELQLHNVKFLGLKPKKELPIWVQNSLYTLFATLDNPVQATCSPNKIFDSFAAGVPIVQTSQGWIKDLVTNHYCGITIELADPKTAAEKIYQTSSEDLEKMSENAKKLALTEFDRSLLAKKYLQHLSEIVGKSA